VRKLVVSEFVSLDGIMEDPGGSEKTPNGGWAFQFNRGPEGDKFKLDELLASDALLLGRVTYEGFATAWPGRTDEAGFADRMNTIPKYVVSTTLDKVEWNNSILIKKDIPENIAELKMESGMDILVAGSCSLVQTLIRFDLIDEYRLMVFPILLGSGKRLFDEGSYKKDLRLVEARPVGMEGVLTLIYQPDSKQ
jgi:dihydrofolate reductase